MTKLADQLITAALSALVPIAGGLYFLGQQSNRIEQLERRVAVLEQRPITVQPTRDSVRDECAALAHRYADPKSDTYQIQQSMDALGCVRATSIETR